MRISLYVSSDKGVKRIPVHSAPDGPTSSELHLPVRGGTRWLPNPTESLLSAAAISAATPKNVGFQDLAPKAVTDCYSLHVGLFHTLLHAGLSRRSVCHGIPRAHARPGPHTCLPRRAEDSRSLSPAFPRGSALALRHGAAYHDDILGLLRRLCLGRHFSEGKDHGGRGTVS